MAKLSEIVDILDRELAIDDYEDCSNNGLQLGEEREIERICTGVDASMEFFQNAEKMGAQLLICHHGISWGDSLKRITDINYRRVKYLMDHGLCLYACHLPLDAHPELGNNIQICRALKLRNLEPFGVYNGRPIGFKGELPEAVAFEDFVNTAAAVFGNITTTMDFGRDEVESVAVVSGGAADEVEEAGLKGIDAYISGEPKLTAWHLAQEYGVNAIFAGHYATEVFGVRAVAKYLVERLDIEAQFIDLGIKL